MKLACHSLLLAFLLGACSDQTASTLQSQSAETAAVLDEAPFHLDEADYEHDFNTYVLPRIAAGEASFITGVGGKKLFTYRLIHPEAKANVLVSHGYGESLLKYRETIHNLYTLGYSVYFWEHRGHAHSDRLLADRYKTHVEDFDDYVEDMEIFMATQVPKDKPLLLFAHSMGGAIALSYMERHPAVFSAAVLNAPLLDLNTEPYPGWVARALAGVLDFFGRDEDFAPGQKTFSPDTWVFEKASTSSRARFERTRTDTIAEDLALGGVTIKWLREALKTTRNLTKKAVSSRVSTPILMFQAGQDTFVKPSGQNRFCEQAPDCTLIKVPESRHEIFNEVDSLRRPFWDEAALFFESHL